MVVLRNLCVLAQFSGSELDAYRTMESPVWRGGGALLALSGTPLMLVFSFFLNSAWIRLLGLEAG
jgi:hypothetical protein